MLFKAISTLLFFILRELMGLFELLLNLWTKKHFEIC